MVGSGEYTEAMVEVERGLIHGRSPRYVQIPTAASAEGADRLAYWVKLGRAQADRLGVEAVPLVVTARDQAADPATAAQVAGAGLIYLSGGSPTLLAKTLRDTALWHAILGQGQAGAALGRPSSRKSRRVMDTLPSHPARSRSYEMRSEARVRRPTRPRR